MRDLHRFLKRQNGGTRSTQAVQAVMTETASCPDGWCLKSTSLAHTHTKESFSNRESCEMLAHRPAKQMPRNAALRDLLRHCGIIDSTLAPGSKALLRGILPLPNGIMGSCLSHLSFPIERKLQLDVSPLR
jgi:hypothetical protein